MKKKKIKPCQTVFLRLRNRLTVALNSVWCLRKMRTRAGPPLYFVFSLKLYRTFSPSFSLEQMREKQKIFVTLLFHTYLILTLIVRFFFFFSINMLVSAIISPLVDVISGGPPFFQQVVLEIRMRIQSSWNYIQ